MRTAHNRLISGGPDATGWRLPAPALEKAVAEATAKHIEQRARTHRIRRSADLQSGEAIKEKAADLSQRLVTQEPDLIKRLVVSGCLGKDSITLNLDGTELATELGIDAGDFDPSALQIDAPFTLRRRGVEGKIVIGERRPEPDPTLSRALAHAHGWINDLRHGKSLGAIAAVTGHSGSYIRTRSQLVFLSPAIQKMILDGRQPPDLTLEKIIRKPIPLDWEAQAKLYGFG